MKFLSLIAFVVLSFSVFSAENKFVLNSKTINIGPIDQQTRGAALGRIQIVRTKNTPRKVDLKYLIKKSEARCVHYEYQQVWHPGHYDHICRTNTDRHGRTRTICRDVWQPGYYTTERRCAQWDTIMVNKSKKIRLNFKRASSLKQNEKETFVVEFRQKRVDSSKMILSAEVLEARRNYSIKYETFLKDSLKFKVK